MDGWMDEWMDRQYPGSAIKLERKPEETVSNGPVSPY